MDHDVEDLEAEAEDLEVEAEDLEVEAEDLVAEAEVHHDLQHVEGVSSIYSPHAVAIQSLNDMPQPSVAIA